jgi:Tol biopolymer transport system component
MRKLRPTIITAGALALAALIAAAGPARATYPGANGRIAFGMTASGAAQPDVYSLLPGGEAVHQLTDDPAFEACAAYSADGKQIAYCSSVGDPAGQFDIWTMKQNGKDKRRLTQLGGNAIFPDLSPDGSRIAFNALPAGADNQDVYVMNADGSGLVDVTNAPGNDLYPAWSPDGTQIAFLDFGSRTLYVMNADGSGPYAVHPGGVQFVPAWQPHQTTTTKGADRDRSPSHEAGRGTRRSGGGHPRGGDHGAGPGDPGSHDDSGGRGRRPVR